MDAHLFIIEKRGNVTELRAGDAIDIPVNFNAGTAEITEASDAFVATIVEIRACYQPADGVYVPHVTVEFPGDCEGETIYIPLRFDCFFEHMFVTVGRQVFNGMVEDLR